MLDITTKNRRRRERIIVSLDINDMDACKRILSNLFPLVKIYKVGSQFFTACGHEAINFLKRKGAGMFLDLKFHDIPSTVGNASASATALGVDIFTVHTFGGFSMMKKARELSDEVADRLKIRRPMILGVTVLTSMGKNDLGLLGIKKGLKEQVLFLAKQAKEAGLNGVIASAGEVISIKKRCGKDFVVVTPGIRPSWAQTQDQRRVYTPREAFDKGADYIIIGRPITAAEDPRFAIERIFGELENEK